MSDGKKKRMSMLDKLAAGTTPEPAPMMSTNRALRAARDAVDGHQVWDLDPAQIDDLRVADRLDPRDVLDLQDSIEATGQTVPILVRRHPTDPERYLLVYGRRRLEAIRNSNSVNTIRALIANIDEGAAVEAQISENMARRDLSYIEKALFAHELIESGFGSQTKVAEVLTVSKSSVSMSLGIVGALGADLIRAIGPAPGVGRPRWQALADAIETSHEDLEDLIVFVANHQDMTAMGMGPDGKDTETELSVLAFEAVLDRVQNRHPKPVEPRDRAPAPLKRRLQADGKDIASVQRTSKALRIEINDSPFADWIEDQTQAIIAELHDRWIKR